MTGIMDIGGGLRAVYSAGVYDYLLDEGISLDYCIGVSAGSANLITYVARQNKRNYVFYNEYAFRREYMSLGNFLRTGSYLDLDYIYSDLCNRGSEQELDYEAFRTSPSDYVCVATNAVTGKPEYFGKKDVQQDCYDILKASCAIPAVCKPYKIGENHYYDGGVSDPFPYKKAFADGCDRLIAVVMRPLDYVKPPQKHMNALRAVLRKYPLIADEIAERHTKYNNGVRELRELEREGRVLIIAPRDCFGVETLTRDRAALNRLFRSGYEDGKRIAEFIK